MWTKYSQSICTLSPPYLWCSYVCQAFYAVFMYLNTVWMNGEALWWLPPLYPLQKVWVHFSVQVQHEVQVFLYFTQKIVSSPFNISVVLSPVFYPISFPICAVSGINRLFFTLWLCDLLQHTLAIWLVLEYFWQMKYR